MHLEGLRQWPERSLLVFCLSPFLFLEEYPFSVLSHRKKANTLKQQQPIIESTCYIKHSRFYKLLKFQSFLKMRGSKGCGPAVMCLLSTSKFWVLPLALREKINSKYFLISYFYFSLFVFEFKGKKKTNQQNNKCLKSQSLKKGKKPVLAYTCNFSA